LTIFQEIGNLKSGEFGISKSGISEAEICEAEIGKSKYSEFKFANRKIGVSGNGEEEIDHYELANNYW